MRILTSQEMHQLDALTIQHEGITSLALMERASAQIAAEIENRWPQDTPVCAFAGAGGNGGDALCVSRLLAEKGYKVETYLFNTENNLSPDCASQRELLQSRAAEIENLTFVEVSASFVPPTLTAQTVVLDGLFGSGLSRPLVGGFAAVVRYINASPATVVSIDVPSGLGDEMCADAAKDVIVRADYTFTLQHPPLSFFFAENEKFVGNWQVLDIGLLDVGTLGEELTFANKFFFTSPTDVLQLLRPRATFSHKGTFGHAVLVAGSQTMPGAAVLAAKACLRSGVGKLTVRTSSANRDVLAVKVPEAIMSLDPNEHCTESFAIDDYDAMGIGPGLGQHPDTVEALADILFGLQMPTVLDADALNILSTHRHWLNQLPTGTILTPHRGELGRLLGDEKLNSRRLLQQTLDFAAANDVIVVMKGAYTSIVTPDGRVFINPTGNPGMATAGAGDVLTGVLLALLAQGYDSLDAVRLGVYVHGLAGDFAADRLGQVSLIASDIVESLPQAFKFVENM